MPNHWYNKIAGVCKKYKKNNRRKDPCLSHVQVLERNRIKVLEKRAENRLINFSYLISDFRIIYLESIQ